MKKYGITLEDLNRLPKPEKLGPRHAPVPHGRLVTELRKALDHRSIELVGEDYNLYRDGHLLIGTLDVRSLVVGGDHPGMGFRIGLRNSTNQDRAINLGVGRVVFVCANGIFSADLIALRRKNTSGIDLLREIGDGVDVWMRRQGELSSQIKRAECRVLSDREARDTIYDEFVAGTLPGNRFARVHRNYFEPTRDMTDCHGGHMMALHNAFTREVRGLKPARAFEATTRLGRLLQS